MLVSRKKRSSLGVTKSVPRCKCGRVMTSFKHVFCYICRRQQKAA